jgi:diguanylate cyclase (GGDEF)-like protein/PAS domain S-box-containing protein
LTSIQGKATHPLPTIHPMAAFVDAAAALRRSHPDFALSGAFWLGLQGDVIGVDPLGELLIGSGNDTWSGAWVTQLEPGLSTAAWADRRQRLYDSAQRFFTRMARADGNNLEVEVLASLQTVGARTYILQLVRNSPIAPALQRSLDELKGRYELIGHASNDGLWVWDFRSGDVEYSPRWAALMGFTEARLVGTIDMWLERVHPADRAAVDAALGAHLDGDEPLLSIEHRLEHRAGTWKWVHIRGLAERGADGTLARMAASTSDITHRKNSDERLRYEAFHDSLTGLANRAWLIHRIHDALSHSRTSGEHFALVQVGVDGFKLVNDSFGLSLGDMLLRAIAARIARCVRSIDTVARVGGDEFLILLEGLEDPAQVEIVADRIAQDIAQPFDLRGYAVYSSVSMGIVPSSTDYNEPEDLLRDANIALVQAKRAGRARRVVFDLSMRHATVRRLMLETDLRRALERAELQLAFQPVVDLASLEVVGFEALCRWNHAKHGVIGPNEFIPLAEDSGLIMPIGRWALVTACEEARSWPSRLAAKGPTNRPLWVSVNVSGRQLAQPGFVAEVSEILKESGLAPELLHLEITESVLMENAENSKALLHELRGLGVNLSIDDFGTGYSSLAYLRRFPIETLKIDRAFLAPDADTEDSWAIIETIRSLASILGIGVIVEGVETHEHLSRLTAMGCQAAQGYLLARPIPERALDAYLDTLVGGRVTVQSMDVSPDDVAITWKPQRDHSDER